MSLQKKKKIWKPIEGTTYHLSFSYWSKSINEFIFPSSWNSPKWSVNFAICPAHQNIYFRYFTITSFTLLCFRITSLRVGYGDDIPIMDLYIALWFIDRLYSFPLVIDNISLATNIAGKTLLLKILTRFLLSSFCLEHILCSGKWLQTWFYYPRDFHLHISAHIHHPRLKSTYLINFLDFMASHHWSAQWYFSGSHEFSWFFFVCLFYCSLSWGLRLNFHCSVQS